MRFSEAVSSCYQYIKILTCVCVCVCVFVLDGSGMFVGRD